MNIRCPNPERLLILPCLILLLAGCRGIGTQSFTAFTPSQAQELTASSRTVLDVRCTAAMSQADYNLYENLQMLAPMPKRFKLDVTFQVERVVKGEFSEQTLKLHWLRDPTKRQYETLGILRRDGFAAGFVFTNGMPLRIGFDARTDQHFRELKLLIRHD